MHDSLLARDEAEGYTVIVHPSLDVLPPFRENYRPDAIALKCGKKVAIEIKTSRRDVELNRLPAMFAQHPEWELRVYYAPEQPSERALSAPDSSAIEAAVQELTGLRNSGHLTAALVNGWAVLEAVQQDPAARIGNMTSAVGRVMTAAALPETGAGVMLGAGCKEETRCRCRKTSARRSRTSRTR